jgi:hypothetical protein
VPGAISLLLLGFLSIGCVGRVRDGQTSGLIYILRVRLDEEISNQRRYGTGGQRAFRSLSSCTSLYKIKQDPGRFLWFY